MFDIDRRDDVRSRVLQLAEADPRVVAAAVVGSLARGPGDRWSDLDLTFALAPGVPLTDLLDEWQDKLQAEFAALPLFDVRAGPFLYRVLLLPGGLQVDISVAPAAEFRAQGPEFRLLFGEAGPPAEPGSMRPVAEMFGYAVHHLLRARVAIERGRALQAEQWIGSLRAEILALASRRHGVEEWQARGAHRLPAEVQDQLGATLPRSLGLGELRRALHASVDALLVHRHFAGAPVAIESRLRALGELPSAE